MKLYIQVCTQRGTNFTGHTNTRLRGATSHSDLPLIGLSSPLSLPPTTLLLPFPSRVIDMVDLHDALTDLEKLATVPVPHVLNTTRCTHMQVMTQTLSGCSVKTTVG